VVQVSAWRTRLDSMRNSRPDAIPNSRLDATGHPDVDTMAHQCPRIGVAWAGNPGMTRDRARSLSPDRLAPLLEVPGLHFISVQKGSEGAPRNGPMTDFMDEMEDFADTAALVANLQLVISVDTALAHLAAALGKPVWLLDRFDPDWRWLTGRRDSPWYPTLRIYRQPQPEDWDSVLAEVAHDLRRIAGGESISIPTGSAPKPGPSLHPPKCERQVGRA